MVNILSWDFDNSDYFKHSRVNAAKNCVLLVLIFNLQNKKSKYDDDDDPDNNIIKIIWALEINQKFYFCCGEGYWEDLFGTTTNKRSRLWHSHKFFNSSL